MVLLKEYPHSLQQHLPAKQWFVITDPQKVLRGEQVLPLVMLYKSVNSFLLHHVLLLVQTFDTPNNRPVFCLQTYEYADAVAERAVFGDLP